jgi:hypothetical protein
MAKKLYSDGAPGTPIPGSRYVRGYCAVCGLPVRVTDATDPQIPCYKCSGVWRESTWPHPSRNRGTNGSWHNAVKEYERPSAETWSKRC